MGTDVLEVVEKLPSPCDIKVHSLMCIELRKLVERVVKIFPEIEEARPRCLSGIGSLCLLNDAIDKAKLLLQDCCESSKLYLAFTGNTILSRCKKTKSMLEQSLNEIQNMVPVMLASQISGIIAELRAVTFTLDPSEEEAGKAVKALLERYKTGEFSGKDSGNEYIQIAAVKLQITTQKSVLIERRSIKKLLNKLIEKNGNPQKRKILLFLFDLLKKYGNSIASGQLETIDSIVRDREQDRDYPFRKVDFCVDRDDPPEEFKCPISRKLMYDPVVIDSGQTFERMWIRKWFDEGHDVCPKTNRKLTGFSLTENTSMKDLISRWCEAHGISVSDPFFPVTSDANSWENSSSSINSLSISMNNLQLPIDYSNVSMSSLDNTRELEVESTTNLELDDGLSWEFRCKFVEDLVTRLKHDDQGRKLNMNESFVESIVRFLEVARDKNDVKAQRIGCLLLQILITKFRITRHLNKDAYVLLSGFLDSQVTEQALAILEPLSSHQTCQPDIASSGALPRLLALLDTGTPETQAPALKILRHLTSNRTVRPLVDPSDLIPRLLPLSPHPSLSPYCIAILSNLCNTQPARAVIAGTEGCLPFVAQVLDHESLEEQEQALEVLVSMCSQSVRYCRMVMHEGVIPAVVFVSKNGNEGGRSKAIEMLRLLREAEHDEIMEEGPGPGPGPVATETGGGSRESCTERKTGSRASRIFSKFSRAQKRKI